MYILTFVTHKIIRKIKVGYSFGRVDKYIPATLMCFTCLKFGHDRDSCRGRPKCEKYEHMVSAHTEED